MMTCYRKRRSRGHAVVWTFVVGPTFKIGSYKMCDIKVAL